MTARKVGAQDARLEARLDLPNICFFFLALKLFSKGAKKARNGNGSGTLSDRQ